MRFYTEFKRGYRPPLIFLLVIIMPLLNCAQTKPSSIISLAQNDSNSDIFKQHQKRKTILPEKLVSSITTEEFWSFYEPDLLEDPDCIPLNITKFRPHKFKSNIHIPRFMMEFFSEEGRARRLPEGATTARSYLAISQDLDSEVEANERNSLDSLRSLKKPEEGSADKGTVLNSSRLQKTVQVHPFATDEEEVLPDDPRSTALSDINAVHGPIPNLTLSLSINLDFSPTEKVHSSFLRIYTRTRRKTIDVIGVERRVHVYIINTWTSQSSLELEQILVAQHDLYLLNNSWTEIDVTKAIRMLKKLSLKSCTFALEISANFATVGGQGELSIVTETKKSLSPFIIVYSAPQNPNFDFSLSRGKRSFNSGELEEEETNSIWEGGPSVFTGVPSHVLKGKKLSRKARQKRFKNSCKKKPMTVNFKDIDWEWVIAPQSYEAFRCSGKCFYPLASHWSPTKHAIIQTLVHSKKSGNASRACCVPTKLGPISILYYEGNVTTFNYDYSEMVVLECGCR